MTERRTRPTAAADPKPVRIQRQRVKGWKMPANTVYVGRPSKWGNPYPVECFGGAAKVLEAYRRYVNAPNNPGAEELRAAARSELRGKNLACWCALVDKDGQKVPCHADILLELANAD